VVRPCRREPAASVDLIGGDWRRGKQSFELIVGVIYVRCTSLRSGARDAGEDASWMTVDRPSGEEQLVGEACAVEVHHEAAAKLEFKS
jgi:hypothetical protein